MLSIHRISCDNCKVTLLNNFLLHFLTPHCGITIALCNTFLQPFQILFSIIIIKPKKKDTDFKCIIYTIIWFGSQELEQKTHLSRPGNNQIQGLNFCQRKKRTAGHYNSMRIEYFFKRRVHVNHQQKIARKTFHEIILIIFFPTHFCIKRNILFSKLSSLIFFLVYCTFKQILLASINATLT